MRAFTALSGGLFTLSGNANKIAGSIRAKLKEEDENKAEPIVEEEMDGVETYVTLAGNGYVRTKKESGGALDQAEQALIDKMGKFDYENQMASAS